jgi:hypothetical protein
MERVSDSDHDETLEEAERRWRVAVGAILVATGGLVVVGLAKASIGDDLPWTVACMIGGLLLGVLLLALSRPVTRHRARRREHLTGALYAGISTLREVERTKSIPVTHDALESIRVPWYAGAERSLDNATGVLFVEATSSGPTIRWEPGLWARHRRTGSFALDADQLASVEMGDLDKSTAIRINLTTGDHLHLTASEPRRLRHVLDDVGLLSTN